MSARATVARAFRGADPQTEEEEGSVLDFPEEYVRAVPSVSYTHLTLPTIYSV